MTSEENIFQDSDSIDKRIPQHKKSIRWNIEQKLYLWEKFVHIYIREAFNKISLDSKESSGTPISLEAFDWKLSTLLEIYPNSWLSVVLDI